LRLTGPFLVVHNLGVRYALVILDELGAWHHDAHRDLTTVLVRHPWVVKA
jgi:hypothetical protein